MDKQFVLALTSNEYHLIKSKKTGQPYIERDLFCYMFYLQSEAEEFFKDIPDIEIESSRYFRPAETFARLHSLGINGIHLKEKGRSTFTDIKMEPADIPKRFYNPEMKKDILFIKETKKAEYYYALGQGFFLIPLLIEKRMPKQHPRIHYSYATLGEKGDKYYLLYTSIQEFKKWKTAHEINDDVAPLKITIKEFNRIIGDSPVIINSETDKLVLSATQIGKINRYNEQQGVG